MKIFKNIIIAFVSLISLDVFAVTTPLASGYDQRVVRAKYNPNDVIRVRTKIGAATLIQLSKHENVLTDNSGLGMGDAAAWGLSVRGNNIFLKPVAENPDTNLTVVTNIGRTYVFDLVSSRKPYYLLKMEYEKKKSKNDYTSDNQIPCSTKKRNYFWLKFGDMELSPKYVWSDGVFTCLKFDKNIELPVAYKLTTDQIESLVNFHMENDVMVLHSPAQEFRLRIGKKVLGLKNDSQYFAGFNEKKSTNNKVRMIKDNSNE